MPPPPPTLTELDRPLAEQHFGDVSTLPGPQPAAVVVDREVDDGAVTLGGGTIIGVPGHTPGSLARPADRDERGPQAVGDGAQPVTEA